MELDAFDGGLEGKNLRCLLTRGNVNIPLIYGLVRPLVIEGKEGVERAARRQAFEVQFAWGDFPL